jgi:hypothetical protein
LIYSFVFVFGHRRPQDRLAHQRGHYSCVTKQLF